MFSNYNQWECPGRYIVLLKNVHLHFLSSSTHIVFESYDNMVGYDIIHRVSILNE